jgi:hypothetical protein
MEVHRGKKMRDMRRSLSNKRLQVRQSYYDDYHEDGMLSHQMGSLSMPSEDDDANYFSLSYDGESIVNDPVVDLDRMIAESSARWKCTVTAIVSNTVTANSTVNSALTVSNTSGGRESNTFYTNSNSGSSTGSPQPIQSNEQNTALIGLPMRRPSVITRESSTGTHCTVPSIEHRVIEQQQAEIEALQAAIHAQQMQSSIGFHRNPFHNPSFSRFVPGMSVLNENSAVDVTPMNYNNNFPFRATEENVDCAPIDHIEVHHDANCWQDDLTVWSGFNTVTGHPDSPGGHGHQNDEFDSEEKSPKRNLQRRPDAESATGASALNGIPVRVVNDMSVKLSSGMTGVTRRALYSGTINAHSRLPEGQGTFIFKKTGDMYKGDVHNGMMHGAGTYTFGRSKNGRSRNGSDQASELKGTFEHNVFVG